MEFLFLLFVIFLIGFILSLARLWRGFSLPETVLAWFLVISADIVLVMEISSLLDVLNQPLALAVIQAVLATLGFAANRIFKIGYPWFRPGMLLRGVRDFFSRAWNNKLFSLFLLAVLAVYAYQAVLTIRFPQNLSDVLYNHLSRIGFWLQQGSLKHYTGFSQIGMFYPYNNSLLAVLPIVFLKNSQFVGLVQYTAAWMASLSVYCLAVGLGFRKKSSAIAALITLTYPIILFESVTAQNDLLVACFVIIAFQFLVSSFNSGKRVRLILSALSLALAIGTNQYAAFVLPGYLVLLLYYLISRRKWTVLLPWVCSVTVFTLSVGSYAYLQNMLYYGNPLAPQEFLQNVTRGGEQGGLLPRVATNASRLFAQFISCDGLTPALETQCLKGRALVLRPILPKNIESADYLYDVERFSLSTPYSLNAESSWYGPLSWLLILPALVFSIISGIKKKRFEPLILMGSSLVFFIAIATIKHGWDPYQGRYLISAVILLQPLTAALFDSRRIPLRILTALACAAALVIMLYASLSNQYLPTLSKDLVKKVHTWGVQHSLLVQKVAYKTFPIARYDKDVWEMDDIDIATLAERNYYLWPVQMVEKYVPGDSSLGIAVDKNMFFDFLFRGKAVSRKLTPLIQNGKPVASQDDFILVAPETEYGLVGNYHEIAGLEGWQVLVRDAR